MAVSLAGGAVAAGTRERVRVRTAITAPCARVWSVVSDPYRLLFQLDGVVSVRGPRDGDTWRVELETLGRTLEAQVQIVERVPAQRLVLVVNGALSALLTITVGATGSATALELVLDYVSGGSALRRAVRRRTLTPRLRRRLLALAVQLKAGAEATAPRG